MLISILCSLWLIGWNVYLIAVNSEPVFNMVLLNINIQTLNYALYVVFYKSEL